MSDETPELQEHESAVRLSMWPGKLTAVPTAELPHLRGSGLILDDKPGEPDSGPAAAGGKPTGEGAKDPARSGADKNKEPTP